MTETFLSPEELVQVVDGAQAAVDYFGFWNHCHDAEILEISIRPQACVVSVYAYSPTSPALDRFKRAVLTFTLRGVSDLELTGLYKQNILGSMLFYRVPAGLRVLLESSVGINGWVEAASLTVELYPLH